MCWLKNVFFFLYLFYVFIEFEFRWKLCLHFLIVELHYIWK